MSKRNVAVATLIAVALVLAGGLYASNMGFKLNYVLDGKNTNLSSTGINSIALPYRSPALDASDLLDDVTLAGGDVVQVAKWNPSIDTIGINYTGSGTPFDLDPGEGYFIQLGVANTGGTVPYIIVGSHDPGHVISLDSTPTTKTGLNSFSYPYHSTLTLAAEMINEIDAVGGGAVASVSQWDKTSDGLISYTGFSGTNFGLVPGEGYLVTVAGDVTGYLPSHY
jgi:hypothetical protein